MAPLILLPMPTQEHQMQSTPLHVAVLGSSVGVVQELLKSGAKLDIKDIDGKVYRLRTCTCMMYCTSYLVAVCAYVCVVAIDMHV